MTALSKTLLEANKKFAGVVQMLNNRILLVAPWIETCHHGSDAETGEEKVSKIAQTGDTPHLVTSQLPNGNHKPTLDIDLPCTLEPSATPGKFHLFLDKELTTEQYNDLLLALLAAGVIEKGVYTAQFQKEGYTAYRLPGVKKTYSQNDIKAKPGTWKPDSVEELVPQKSYPKKGSLLTGGDGKTSMFTFETAQGNIQVLEKQDHIEHIHVKAGKDYVWESEHLGEDPDQHNDYLDLI
jgi:hypothetical protein